MDALVHVPEQTVESSIMD